MDLSSCPHPPCLDYLFDANVLLLFRLSVLEQQDRGYRCSATLSPSSPQTQRKDVCSFLRHCCCLTHMPSHATHLLTSSLNCFPPTLSIDVLEEKKARVAERWLYAHCTDTWEVKVTEKAQLGGCQLLVNSQVTVWEKKQHWYWPLWF